MALSYTEIEVEEETFHIFTLPDRRPTAGSSQPIKWLYQMIVESYLYHDGDTQAKGTGAFYRLLQCTPGAAGRAWWPRASASTAPGATGARRSSRPSASRSRARTRGARLH